MTFFTRLETENLFRRKLLLFVALLIVLTVILEIWVVNRLSTYGGKISKLEETKAMLTLENKILENEIAKNSSLFNMEKYSKNLSFEKIKDIQYLKPSDIALNR